jgi:hypothetical protein
MRGDEVKGCISALVLGLDAPSPSKLELPPRSVSVLLLG